MGEMEDNELEMTSFIVVAEYRGNKIPWQNQLLNSETIRHPATTSAAMPSVILEDKKDSRLSRQVYK